MNKRISHEQVKKEILSNPAVSANYEELEEEFQLIKEMLRARQKTGYSQAKIAKAMKTTTSAVSRLESIHVNEKPSPSLATIKKYAHAMGYKLQIKFVARKA